jgi:allophanate hydrolase subunit 2
MQNQHMSSVFKSQLGFARGKKINQNDGLYLKNLTKQILKTSIKAMQILEDPWKPSPFSQEKPMIFQGTFHDSSTSDSSTCRNS